MGKVRSNTLSSRSRICLALRAWMMRFMSLLRSGASVDWSMEIFARLVAPLSVAVRLSDTLI